MKPKLFQLKNEIDRKEDIYQKGSHFKGCCFLAGLTAVGLQLLSETIHFLVRFVSFVSYFCKQKYFKNSLRQKRSALTLPHFSSLSTFLSNTMLLMLNSLNTLSKELAPYEIEYRILPD